MKVQITFVNPHAELRRDLGGYRLTFKYANDNDDPTPLNECSNNCCNNAAIFCSTFFAMEGLLKQCFTDFTNVQKYRWHDGTYPTPFNGMTGELFSDDTDLAHVTYRNLTSTCACISEAVHEISTVCSNAMDKLKIYASKYNKTHKDVHIEFVYVNH